MYKENPLIRQGKKTVICGLILIMLAAIVTACIQPMTLISLSEQSSLFQAKSPLVPEKILLLTKNPWRVVAETRVVLEVDNAQ